MDKIDITIGKPLPNEQIYILDKYGCALPIGQVGELCIAGDGVGMGYLNKPDLTSEKFVDNPFGEGKMYKTGDLAFWREDGEIVYIGRNDFQVKIRGLRVELGEIESAICSVDGVSQSVVIVRKNEKGRQLICAFYTQQYDVEISQIRKAVLEKLPKYMLPHIFTLIDNMPLTSSGKINRKALPEVDLNAAFSVSEYVEPSTELEKSLVKIMEDVLEYSPIGIKDDFFDIGGDSLKAIELISKAHNEGLYLDLQAVFDNATAYKLCKYIEEGDVVENTYSEKDFEEYGNILKINTIDKISKPVKNTIGNILITGVTGYLGIHILDKYLESEEGVAYCLVRGESDEDSKKRLNDILKYYFGDKYKKCSRIRVICGDVTKKITCIDDIDMIIHSAASVKHYGSYKYFYDINVQGTKNIIELAKEKEARLIHISTVSVSGNSFGDDFNSYISKEEKLFFESSLFIGQELHNVYARSKFEAEKLVLSEMNNGLKATICRMGNLTNRYSDGKFQKNYDSNAFAKRIKAALEFGKMPDYLMHLYFEFTPIDYAAQAVMTIAQHFNTKYTVFHINNSKEISFIHFIEAVNELGINIEVLESEKFSEALAQTQKQVEKSYIFQAFVSDMDEQGRLVYDSNIRIKNEFTVKYLELLGFEWCEINSQYIKKWIDCFRKLKYLEV